jgi:hypothetical protein
VLVDKDGKVEFTDNIYEVIKNTTPYTKKIIEDAKFTITLEENSDKSLNGTVLITYLDENGKEQKITSAKMLDAG